MSSAKSFRNIEANKLRITKYYDKKVRDKQFHTGDLVWKVILPNGSKDVNYGKWSPNWEGPYRIVCRVPGNAYIYETLEGKEFSRAINGKFFKKYYSSIWVDSLYSIDYDHQALIADTAHVTFSRKIKSNKS